MILFLVQRVGPLLGPMLKLLEALLTLMHQVAYLILSLGSLSFPLALKKVLLLRRLKLSAGLSKYPSPIPVSKPCQCPLILSRHALPVSFHLLSSDLQRVLMDLFQEPIVILWKVLNQPENVYSIYVYWHVGLGEVRWMMLSQAL